jgi:hypothetical protein
MTRVQRRNPDHTSNISAQTPFAGFSRSAPRATFFPRFAFGSLEGSFRMRLNVNHRNWAETHMTTKTKEIGFRQFQKFGFDRAK